MDQIKDNCVVSIAYRLFVDGEELEEATVDEPLEYLHGAENIVPGLEKALTGKKVGDKFTITLQPADAYGEYDEDDTEVVPREDIPDPVEPGMELLLEDEYGSFFEAVVKEVTDDEVVLDFNPPLAGYEVTYEVEVINIRPAEQEEIEQGFPYGYEEDYFDDFEHDHDHD
ncbi:MAG: peptidylprolyl isomerase [Phototrophicales bacterium]